MGPVLALLASQALADDDLGAVLLEHNTRHRRTEIAQMAVLLSEAGASIATGSVGWATARETEWVSFHQMTLAWGVVNGAIGTIGLARALHDDPASYDLAATWKRDTKLRNVLWVNAGLDVAYLAAGWGLVEWGLRTEDPRKIGFGRSIALQGAFLLAFDVTFAIVFGQHDRALLAEPVVGEVTGLRVGGRF
jgi:hypothetical protein